MKILDRIKKVLKESSLNIRSSETHYSNYTVKVGGKTIKSEEKLTIDGKEVDPKSKEGKEALGRLYRVPDKMDRGFHQMSKVFDKMGKIFDEMAEIFDEL